MVRSVLLTAAVIAAVVVVLIAVASQFQRKLIYFPDAASVPSAGSVIPGARDVVLNTEDGLDLGGWLVSPSVSDRNMTVLVANGNAGDRAGRAPLAEGLAREGFEVLLFDYRGYGGNPGTPTERGLALDASAAYDYLVSEHGVAPQRLLLFGESLGGGVVAGLASNRPVGGIVLRSPFVDLAAVGRVHYPFLPVSWLLHDEFPVATRVADIETPISVIYGSNDSVVPPAQSQVVARDAAHLFAVVTVVGADHSDPALVDGPQVIDAVVDLADHLERPHAR